MTVGGCESTPPPVAVTTPTQTDPVEIALASAAAASTVAARAAFYLDALVQLYGRGNFDEAAEVVARITRDTGSLTDEDRFRFYRIALELRLANDKDIPVGNNAEVTALLARLDPVTAEQKQTLQRIRARLLARSGNHRASAVAWIAIADQLAAEDRDVSEASAAVWGELTGLTIPEVTDLVRNAPTPAGRLWAGLAHDYNRALTSTGQFQIWQAWKRAHPEHAGARFPAPGLERQPHKPKALALLVPLSGPLGGAGKAVRDGFLAALLHAEQATNTAAASDATTVRPYDTTTMTVADAYALAVADGAELIVGPLQKTAVAEVAALSPTIPVLALNQIGGTRDSASAHIPQLALAPEDDAAAIATALAGDAVERIVLFDNGEPWSARARARLLSKQRDFEVVATGRLSTISEATRVVGDALAVTASSERREELVGVLGIALEFTPRRRDNIDAVVALVDQQQLLALKPALDFHFAGDVPVYVPSTALGGALSGLEGVHVCNSPWRLYPSPLRTAAAPLPTSRGSSAPWFAFGVDAYRLANQWYRLTSLREPIWGSTGTLRLDSDGRINRELAWATVRGGHLVPRPSAFRD